ncbi:MAG TPA: class I SAM-dependent methyltransferase [Chloroflexota bacterium]|jgi:2-polyprenyl-3-methyl-5-hydroxy-6-metoxy-1,4-benzoquinol methylase|nr:class I SAM-dependent methyltransferase [Chloroflexota bacterium]
MSMTAGADEISRLTRETQAIWDQNATFWDSRMAEGNDFQLQLVGPASERLLALREGETVLEVACGNGQFARRLAALGAQVVATDFSAVFLERARERTREHADRIDYRLVDATDEAQLLALGERRFDAMVCSMALMDMTTIDPLMRAAARLLTPQGRFVFSTMHPCFNSGPITWVLEEEDRDGEIRTTYAVKVSRYIRPSQSRGLGMLGQPAPHYYFHRALSDLFSAAFRAGLVLDALEEPVFDDRTSSPRPLSWANYREIPPVLVARLRMG